MSAAEKFQHKISGKIRDYAMTFPETVGRLVVRQSRFQGRREELPVRRREGRRVQHASEAEGLHRRDEQARQEGTGTVRCGDRGWTLIRFPPNKPPPLKDLKRWITESFYLLARKKVIALLDG